MNDSLEEKRKEIFELHKSWLESSAPLMRKQAPVPAPKPVKSETETPDTDAPKRNWKMIAILVAAGILVLLEILFFASEMKWFR